MKEYTDLLTKNGFSSADQVKDFGSVINGVVYAVKKTGNIHQYVSLVSYDGKFCEAVYEFFVAEKNTRRPKGLLKAHEMAARGFCPILGMLLRSLNDLNFHTSKSDVELKEFSDLQMKSLTKLQFQ